MMEVLLPENRLVVSDALLNRLIEEIPAVRWREMDESVKLAYARHIILLDERLRGELGVADLSDLDAFYNAYYWALVFAKQYKSRYGFDAGVEQEAFEVLERAPEDVDWSVVERVKQSAETA